MRESRSKRWLQAVLLAAPLVVLTAWLASGAVNRSQGPVPTSSGAPEIKGPKAASRGPFAGALPGAELPAPESDLPADRLDERVDGAADYFRGLGCVRLLAWRLASPPADLELLVFDKSDGAAAALARDAGQGRDAGPGNEASVSEQAILFRRGPVYARLLADPDAPAEPGQLKAVAVRLDRALQDGNAASGLRGAAGGAGL